MASKTIEGNQNKKIKNKKTKKKNRNPQSSLILKEVFLKK